MNLSLKLACVLTLATVGAHAEQDVITESFNVKQGDMLHMRVDRGSIKVVTADTETVDIKVVRDVKRASDSEAREVYEKHQIEIAQEDDTIRIEADNPSPGVRKRFFFFWRTMQHPFQNLQVEYIITIPSGFDVDLRTAGGNIDLDELSGDVQLHTSGGHITMGSITGPIKAQTSGGNVTLNDGKGDVDLHTSGGHLKIGSIDGDLVAKTSGGNITLDQIKGATDASTSGGNINLRSAQGPVKARTSGGNVSAHLLEQPTVDCSLRTSGGHIKVTLAERLALDVNARTSGGRITSDFPGQMNKQRSKLTAQVNGGGPELVLDTSGGNIDIRSN
ncbi:MAG: DUF4097 family beta strand repeat-containing protein [Limisphaerales bacterium]